MVYFLTQNDDYIGINESSELPDGVKEITEQEYNDYINGVSPPAYFKDSDDIWKDRQTWTPDIPSAMYEDTSYTITTPACTNLMVDSRSVSSWDILYNSPGIYKNIVEPFPEYLPYEALFTIEAVDGKEIERKVAQLESDCRSYIDSRVPSDVQQWLHAVFTGDRTDQTQKDKASDVFNWINNVLHYMYDVRDEFENLNFIEYDFTTYDDTLPDITLRECLPAPVSMMKHKGDGKFGF